MCRFLSTASKGNVLFNDGTCGLRIVNRSVILVDDLFGNVDIV